MVGTRCEMTATRIGWWWEEAACLKVRPIALTGTLSVGCKKKNRVSEDLNALGLRNGMVGLPSRETVKAAAGPERKPVSTWPCSA